MGLPYGENCMILTSTVFDWSTRVTDRRTGDSIYALQHMLSRVKTAAYRQDLSLVTCIVDCLKSGVSSDSNALTEYVTNFTFLDPNQMATKVIVISVRGYCGSLCLLVVFVRWFISSLTFWDSTFPNRLETETSNGPPVGNGLWRIKWSRDWNIRWPSVRGLYSLGALSSSCYQFSTNA